MHRSEKKSGGSGPKLEGLRDLLNSVWLNDSFFRANGLAGLLLVDIVNFSIPIDKVWEELIYHAVLQVGLADILHIALAQHLGCQYFTGFDSDFRRLFDSYGDLIKMTLLSTPSEILTAIS